MDSSESMTTTDSSFCWAALASKATTVLLPLPPFPQTEIFMVFLCCSVCAGSAEQCALRGMSIPLDMPVSPDRTPDQAFRRISMIACSRNRCIADPFIIGQFRPPRPADQFGPGKPRRACFRTGPLANPLLEGGPSGDEGARSMPRGQREE